MPKNIYKKSPFGEGSDWNLNACVGTNGGPYNYMDYARGYFQTGHTIYEGIVNDTNILIDIAIYPLLYVYRHALELSLKHILNLSPDSVKKIHTLPDLWKAARPIAQSFLDEKDNSVLGVIEGAVLNFNTIDPNAEVARFPENKKGEAYLQDMGIINIEPIYKQMKELEKAFEYLEDTRMASMEDQDA